jgi:murein DD-endopeptidase MepM/ murein hydrolase activator NlpD
MRRSWITAGSLALLWVAGGPAHAQPAPAIPTSKKPTPKTSVKTKPKKSAPPATRKKTAPAPVVRMKPPAEIPIVTEAASVWQGCLGPGDLHVLASRMRIDETRLESLLAEENLFGGGGSKCIPSVAVTGGEGGVASATFRRPEPAAGSSPILTLRKTEDGMTVTPGVCDCPEPVRRVLAAPAREAADLSKDVIVGLPPYVRWQLDVLLPQMIGRLAQTQAAVSEADLNAGAGSSAEESVRPTESGIDAYTVRVVLESPGESGPEHLQSIEIVESATGKRVDGVWWLERPDGPGVFLGTDGLVYQRVLWQSPVKYSMKTRGVGPIVNTYQRKVAAPKGSKGPATVVRTFVARGVHLGVDMLAPKGTDVHAVGDAKVSFAGRLGGFGNLIILDHGRGYQTYYAHLSRIGKGVKPGANVAGGEVIGLVGSTGHSTAPHLHFETRKDAVYIDPFDETRQLGFWLLTADDQERLAMELLTSGPAFARDERIANGQEHAVSDDTR